MQVGELLASLTAPQALALVDLTIKAGQAVAHRLAEAKAEDLAALRDQLHAVVISDTDAAIDVGRHQAGG